MVVSKYNDLLITRLKILVKIRGLFGECFIENYNLLHSVMSTEALKNKKICEKQVVGSCL